MSIPKNPGSNPMFSFEGKDVRVILRDGQPWFVAVDVARALQLYLKGGNSVNTATMVRTLGNDEQEYVAPKNIGGIVDNRVGMFLTISESGLYKIIMRASPNKNDRVKKFQDWVTRDVLPALRKDGMYVIGEEKVKTGEMSEDELVLKAMTLLQGKVSRVTQERDQALATIDKHLLNMTVQEWLANNGHYAHMRDAQELGRQAKKLAMEKGLEIGREVKLVPHPYNPGEKIQSKVNVYPLSVLDIAGKAMGFAANMKVA